MKDWEGFSEDVVRTSLEQYPVDVDRLLRMIDLVNFVDYILLSGEDILFSGEDTTDHVTGLSKTIEAIKHPTTPETRLTGQGALDGSLTAQRALHKGAEALSRELGIEKTASSDPGLIDGHTLREFFDSTSREAVTWINSNRTSVKLYENDTVCAEFAKDKVQVGDGHSDFYCMRGKTTFTDWEYFQNCATSKYNLPTGVFAKHRPLWLVSPQTNGRTP